MAAERQGRTRAHRSSASIKRAIKVLMAVRMGLELCRAGGRRRWCIRSFASRSSIWGPVVLLGLSPVSSAIHAKDLTCERSHAANGLVDPLSLPAGIRVKGWARIDPPEASSVSRSTAQTPNPGTHRSITGAGDRRPCPAARWIKVRGIGFCGIGAWPDHAALVYAGAGAYGRMRSSAGPNSRLAARRSKSCCNPNQYPSLSPK
jgi:hypothetical protein